MFRIDENTEIDDKLVMCNEYEIFINEMREQRKYHQPVHWDSDQSLNGQRKKPILGVQYSDVSAFCQWMTQREPRTWLYRLPRADEAAMYPLSQSGLNGLNGLAYWAIEPSSNEPKLIGAISCAPVTQRCQILQQRFEQDMAACNLESDLSRALEHVTADPLNHAYLLSLAHLVENGCQDDLTSNLHDAISLVLERFDTTEFSGPLDTSQIVDFDDHLRLALRRELEYALLVVNFLDCGRKYAVKSSLFKQIVDWFDRAHTQSLLYDIRSTCDHQAHLAEDLDDAERLPDLKIVQYDACKLTSNVVYAIERASKRRRHHALALALAHDFQGVVDCLHSIERIKAIDNVRAFIGHDLVSKRKFPGKSRNASGGEALLKLVLLLAPSLRDQAANTEQEAHFAHSSKPGKLEYTSKFIDTCLKVYLTALILNERRNGSLPAIESIRLARERMR